MHFHCPTARIRPAAVTIYAVLCAGATVSLAILPGCQNGDGLSTAGASSGIAPKPAPVESFQRIVDFFRREVADPRGGFISSRDGKFSKLQFEREVRDEFFPPTEENGVYTGKITVITTSTYTYRGALEDPDSDNDSRSNSRDSGSARDDENQDSLAALGEAALEGTIDAGSSSEVDIPKAIVTDIEDADQQTYELVYENGRWILKTKPDPDTEKFIQAAFDFALKHQ